MSEQTNPLERVLRAESALFRLGVVARRLIAEHPDLPVRSITPYLGAPDGTLPDGLTINPGSADGFMQWAAALGAAAEPDDVTDHGDYGYRYHAATGAVDGIRVTLSRVALLSRDEIAAWRAEQAGGA